MLAPRFALPRDAEQHPRVAQGWMNVAKMLWESATAFLQARCPCTEQFCSSWRGGSDFTALEGTLEASPLAGRCCSSSGCAAASREGAWGEPGYRPPSSASGFFKGDKNQEAKENVLRCAAGLGVACCSSSRGFCCCHRCVTGAGASSGRSQGGRGLSWAQQEGFFFPGLCQIWCCFQG